MASYTVVYSCGHSAARQLYGKHADRDRFIAWAAREGLCDACRKDRAAAGCEAVEAEHGLPPLLGTERQVEWARGIRAKAVSEIEEYFQLVMAQADGSRLAQYEENCAAVRETLMAKTDARWWIDHRYASASRLANDLFLEIQE